MENVNNKENSVPTIETVVLEYCKNIFTKEKNDEFFNNLDDEQKEFMYAFISGFQSALGRRITGVYDYDYVNSFKINQEILKNVHILLRPVEVKDEDLKFVVVTQLNN